MEVSNPALAKTFLVQILCGGSVIGHTTDPAPAPIASKEPEKEKDILVSTSWWEVSNHTIWNPI